MASNRVCAGLLLVLLGTACSEDSEGGAPSEERSEGSGGASMTDGSGGAVAASGGSENGGATGSGGEGVTPSGTGGEAPATGGAGSDSPPGPGTSACDPDSIVVDSLAELLPYLDDDNVKVQLAPGTYEISAQDVDNGDFGHPIFSIEGSGSEFCFTGVTINYDTDLLQVFGGSVDFTHLHVWGNDNVLKNLTMVDVGSTEDRPAWRSTNVVIDGKNNRVEGFHITVKGSFPYGYGDIFGKGGGSVIGHKKHCGLLVRGDYNHVKDVTMIHRAYGHGIYMQAADHATIEGCHVEGELRTTDEVLAEEGTGSPADEVDFQTVWGYRLQPGFTFSLQEDGIRAYNGGTTYIDGVAIERGVTNTTVIDSTVKFMRSGVTIGWSRGDNYVENCTALGDESGFWVGTGQVVNCRGDASVGPLYSEDRASSRSSIELTLLDNIVPKHGTTPTVYLAGSNHDFTLKDGTTSFDPEVHVLIGGTRLGHRWLEGTEIDASNHVIDNQTAYPVILGDNSSDNEVTSCGTVTDDGSGNDVSDGSDCQ